MNLGVWLVIGAPASGKSTVARKYAEAGFTAVVQDNLYGADVVRWVERVQWAPLHLVVLRPSIKVLERREVARREATGRVAYTDTFTPAQNDALVAATDRERGLWLDMSTQTAEETVAEILAREVEARIAS